jgi:hypothetical protein
MEGFSEHFEIELKGFTFEIAVKGIGTHTLFGV